MYLTQITWTEIERPNPKRVKGNIKDSTEYKNSKILGYKPN